MTVVAELLDLMLPSACVVCRKPCGVGCCEPCRTAIRPSTFHLDAGLAVHAAGDYGGWLRECLLHYKERGRRRLAPLLARLLLPPMANASGGLPVVLVPVPSRSAAARSRGGDHIARLARLVGALSGQPVARTLTLASGVRDSAGLSKSERSRNLDHRMTARAPSGGQRFRQAVLIDDIVTTGATLQECQRALQAAGWQVTAAVVLARTAGRNRPIPAEEGVDFGWASRSGGSTVAVT